MLYYFNQSSPFTNNQRIYYIMHVTSELCSPDLRSLKDMSIMYACCSQFGLQTEELVAKECAHLTHCGIYELDLQLGWNFYLLEVK